MWSPRQTCREASVIGALNPILKEACLAIAAQGASLIPSGREEGKVDFLEEGVLHRIWKDGKGRRLGGSGTTKGPVV